MPKARPVFCHSNAPSWLRGCALLLLVGFFLQTGCGKLTYDRVNIGMVPREYDRALDLDETTRTAHGLVQYSKSVTGQEVALLLTVADDRRISGKMRVSRAEASETWPPRDFYYILSAEFDTAMIGAADAGPIDALRLVTQKMSELPTERSSRRGQSLALAGLVRVLQRQQGIQEIGFPELSAGELVGIVPDEGFASLERDATGRLQIGFRVGQEP